MSLARTTLSLLIIAAPCALVAQAPALVLDADALSGLRARDIGPAVMSGRLTALDGFLEKGRATLYTGAASGGLWKTANGGTTWKPVFDKHNQSVGAVRVDPRDPRTVWVGTGESWVRNSVSVGDGVYRTVDGGDTWERLGLAASERIADICVDPRDSANVYAAAMGPLWSAGGERGLYRTRDAGKTWTRILFVDENTGCSGLVMDPKNPDVLFAAMWDYRRTGWSFRSGGPGSNLYRSADGGATWTPLVTDGRNGLPAGELGRVVVAVAPSDPRIVYAALESRDSALYRSEDGGLTWALRFKGAKVLDRPFYFGAMTVDPSNPDRLYKMGTFMAVSEDGGRSFTQIGQSTHADHHAIWINPANTECLYLATDGGFCSSEDRGTAWRFHKNLPIAQFYHVSADNSRPYRIFGGLQDNSTWMGYGHTTLSNRHWKNIFGGDGFWSFADPSDPGYAYAEAQGGYMARVNLATLATHSIKPQESAGEDKFRFNWSTPIVPSPTRKDVIYTGAQYLFRSRDKGDTWQRISPDLTTNNKALQNQEESGGVTLDNSSAENHCTIYAIGESPKNPLVVWVGTDDGRLQVTRDGGKTWTDQSPKVPGLPKGTWVSWVEPSPHAQGTAFATFDGHTTGDMTTRVYRTDDFGGTWKPLATADVKGFAHVIRQDPVRKDLLYLGTESGLFISLDGGAHWAAFKGGKFPQVPVRDLAIHPREHDLIIATHGRGIWIVDDLTPLRALRPETLAKDVALLPSRPAQTNESGSDGWVEGDLEFTGEDRPDGAVIAYWQKKRHMFGDLKVDILDAKGTVLQTLPGQKSRGLNRITWNRRAKPPRMAVGATPAYAGFIGPEVLEGTYTVRLTKGKEVVTTPLVLQPDPSSTFTPADRQARHAASMQIFGMLEDMAFRVERIRALRDEARARAVEAKDPSLRTRLEALAAQAETHRAKFVPVKEVEGITGEERLREKAGEVYESLSSYRGRPSKALMDRMGALRKDIAAAEGAFEADLGKALADLNPALTKGGLKALAPLERSAWEVQTSGK